MEFEIGGTDHRGADANWVQATGPIDPDTPDKFLEYLKTGKFYRKRLRLDSSGGDLMAGMRLGAILRDQGWATEIGGHDPDPEWAHLPYWKMTKRTPGECASACAFAFMGGVERRIDAGSSLGFHQFYRAEYFSDPNSLSFNATDLQVDQIISAILLSYTISMGVNPAILVKAGTTLPGEMHWVTRDEMRQYEITFDSHQWLPWEITLLREGVIAESERRDSLFKMAALCTKAGGAFFDIFVSSKNEYDLRSWMKDQCLPAGDQILGQGRHSILGNVVRERDFRFIDRPGGYGIRISLGHYPVIGTDPSVFWNDYPSACMTNDMKGSEVRLQEALKIAFRNCIQ
jgi:hypothetical protein